MNRRIQLIGSLGLALTLFLSAFVTVTTAQTENYPAPPQVTPTPPPQKVQSLTGLAYAQVLTGSVPVYQHPMHAAQAASPLRTLDQGYVWVTLQSTQPITHQNQAWYAINTDEFVQADFLEIYEPSLFQGKRIATQKPFAWIVFDTYTAPQAGALPEENTILLKRYTTVNIYETQTIDGRDWYRVGQGHWVEQGMVGIASPKARPAGIAPDEKWIEIDLYEQTLAAYEGDRMVYATLISSGLPWWKTETGLFRVWVKTDRHKMSGREGYPDYYFLEDVPWTMYFNGDFALHGAYWHDRFGIKHSHGCVNMSLADSRWLFEWSSPEGKRGWSLPSEEEPGTWVWVHDKAG